VRFPITAGYPVRKRGGSLSEQSDDVLLGSLASAPITEKSCSGGVAMSLLFPRDLINRTTTSDYAKVCKPTVSPMSWSDLP